jgi:hypothetical protein
VEVGTEVLLVGRNPNAVGMTVQHFFPVFSHSDIVFSEFPVVLNSLKPEIFQFQVFNCFERVRNAGLTWPKYSNFSGPWRYPLVCDIQLVVMILSHRCNSPTDSAKVESQAALLLDTLLT